MTEPVGSCCIVLHTHLPWVLHHGAWPVGEEWLHQAWATAYIPLTRMLDTLAVEGRRELLTLGVTPAVAAQLDDPYALREFHTWLGFWRTRAETLAHRPGSVGALGRREVALAEEVLIDFENRWRAGGSPVWRPLVDAGVVEVLGGPAAHPFLPLLEERVAEFALGAGLDDATVRLGRRPTGIWAPECGYRPGLEGLFARQGVDHLMLDGPTLLGAGASTADAWTLDDTDVVAFGRDLDLTYRVWSPRRGYPGGRWYRDFHAFDHPTGLRVSRVTSMRTEPADKAPYDPERAAAALRVDVADFVSRTRERLLALRAARSGRPGVVVVAYDTELFGHWWHEGPQFLEGVLRALPAADVRLTTLAGAIESGAVAGSVSPGAGSWGSGKDWRVWDGPLVADLNDGSAAIQARLIKLVEAQLDRGGAGSSVGDGTVASRTARRADLDQLARDALLALSSDWAFMISHDSAAAYARERAAGHAAAFDRIAAAIEKRPDLARDLAADQRATDGPFPHLDARLL